MQTRGKRPPRRFARWVGSAAFAALREASESPDVEIRKRARSLIRQMGGDQTARGVRRLMAIRTLGELGKPEAVATLKPLLIRRNCSKPSTRRSRSKRSKAIGRRPRHDPSRRASRKTSGCCRRIVTRLASWSPAGARRSGWRSSCRPSRVTISFARKSRRRIPRRWCSVLPRRSATCGLTPSRLASSGR